MFEHRVENRQQLPHAGDQCHFRGLPRGAQPLVEGFEDGVPSHGGQGAHVQRGPHHGTATPSRATAPQRATVAIQGRYPYQGRDLVTRQGAQLGQLGHERPTQRGPHAGHTLQQVVPLAPDRGRLDALRQLLLDCGHLAVQPGEVLADLLLDAVWGTAQPIGRKQRGRESFPASKTTAFSQS